MHKGKLSLSAKISIGFIILCIILGVIFGIIFSKNDITLTSKELFTAPGLTLTKSPSWFPQYSSQKYDITDWQSKMYLDRYPFKINNKGENCVNSGTMGGKGPRPDYLTTSQSDQLASAYRFWKI